MDTSVLQHGCASLLEQRQNLTIRLSITPVWQRLACLGPIGEQAVVGSDYFDFFRFWDEAHGMVIGDVAGRGMSASLLMAGL